MRQEIDTFANLDEPSVKRALMTSIASMHGLYEVSIKPKRDTRTTRANRYYFACVVQPFFEMLREQDPQVIEKIQVHVELKRAILGTRIVKVGGVTCRIVPTTHDMDTSQFHDYVDRARVWLSSSVGIETPDPGEVGMEYRTTDVPKGAS